MKLKFSPPWWGVLLLILGLGIFIKLGCWQLARAQEKSQMLLLAKDRNGSAYKPLSGLSEITQYQHISVSGTFDDQRIILLDNRFYQHKVGYDVLVPYVVKNKILLVDRGWIGMGLSRSISPHIPPLTLLNSIKGTVYYPYNNSWLVMDKIDAQPKWPLTIAKLDFTKLEIIFKQKIYPFILQLKRSDPNALVRDWRVVTMKPSQHHGYAMQWFTFALAAIIIFIVLNVERSNEN